MAEKKRNALKIQKMLTDEDRRVFLAQMFDIDIALLEADQAKTNALYRKLMKQLKSRAPFIPTFVVDENGEFKLEWTHPRNNSVVVSDDESDMETSEGSDVEDFLCDRSECGSCQKKRKRDVSGADLLLMEAVTDGQSQSFGEESQIPIDVD